MDDGRAGAGLAACSCGAAGSGGCDAVKALPPDSPAKHSRGPRTGLRGQDRRAGGCIAAPPRQASFNCRVGAGLLARRAANCCMTLVAACRPAQLLWPKHIRAQQLMEPAGRTGGARMHKHRHSRAQQRAQSPSSLTPLQPPLLPPITRRTTPARSSPPCAAASPTCPTGQRALHSLDSGASSTSRVLLAASCQLPAAPCLCPPASTPSAPQPPGASPTEPISSGSPSYSPLRRSSRARRCSATQAALRRCGSRGAPAGPAGPAGPSRSCARLCSQRSTSRPAMQPAGRERCSSSNARTLGAGRVHRCWGRAGT